MRPGTSSRSAWCPCDDIVVVLLAVSFSAILTPQLRGCSGGDNPIGWNRLKPNEVVQSLVDLPVSA